jgi:hypothetical protein
MSAGCDHHGRMCPGDMHCDCKCEDCTRKVTKFIVKNPVKAKKQDDNRKGKK